MLSTAQQQRFSIGWFGAVAHSQLLQSDFLQLYFVSLVFLAAAIASTCKYAGSGPTDIYHQQSWMAPGIASVEMTISAAQHADGRVAIGFNLIRAWCNLQICLSAADQMRSMTSASATWPRDQSDMQSESQGKAGAERLQGADKHINTGTAVLMLHLYFLHHTPSHQRTPPVWHPVITVTVVRSY
jgi:hypothetical protein